MEFSDFVVTESNREAYETCVELCSIASSKKNPLVLAGPPAVGKTHLLRGMAREYSRLSNGGRVVYATSHVWADDLFHALVTNDIGTFRNEYLKADSLLLDDVNFLADRPRLRHELFATLRLLTKRKARATLAVTRPADEIRRTTQEISDRFGDITIVELSPPSSGEIRLILERSMSEHVYPLPGAVLDLITGLCHGRLDRAFGLTNRITHYARMNRKLPRSPQIVRWYSDLVGA